MSRAFKRFTKEERAFIKKNAPYMSNEDIGKAMGRTGFSVAWQLSKMGITRDTKAKSLIQRKSPRRKSYYAKNAFRHWTAEEENFIRANYQVMTRKEIAKALGRSYNSVKSKLDKKKGLHLKKSTEAIRALNRRINNGQFKKGQPCATKLHLGSVTVRFSKKNNRRDVYIKVAEPNKWELLQRYIWMIHNKTAIPKKHNIHFKDGKQNYLADNLTLITNADKGRMNSPFTKTDNDSIAIRMARHNPQLRYDILKRPDLIQLQRKQIKLQHLINNATNKRRKKHSPA